MILTAINPFGYAHTGFHLHHLRQAGIGSNITQDVIFEIAGQVINEAILKCMHAL